LFFLQSGAQQNKFKNHCFRLKNCFPLALKFYETNRVVHRSPLAQMEEERREHMMKMKKMEAEMEQVFDMKVKEKKQKLKDSEAEVGLRMRSGGNMLHSCVFIASINVQHDAINDPLKGQTQDFLLSSGPMKVRQLICWLHLKMHTHTTAEKFPQQ